MTRAKSAFAIIFLLATISAFSFENAYAQHYAIGCEIYGRGDQNKMNLLRRFPGELCLFGDDGAFILSRPDEIVRFDKNMKELWTLPIRAHHQINWSADKKLILVIGSETVEIRQASKRERIRSDVLYVIDLNGKIKKQFSFFEQRHRFNEIAWRNAVLRRYPVLWSPSRFSGVKWEITHANSFYEIEGHDAESMRPEFKRGNYIVNDISLMMTFVLSSDLKQILWQRSLRKENWNMVHDVQVLPNGRLLLYDNGTPERAYSQLVEIDLKTLNDVWVYRRQPLKAFFSPRWGGVQRFANGNTLFTDITKVPTCIEIDRKGKVVWTWELAKGKYFQQVRALNLNEFLRHNSGI